MVQINGQLLSRDLPRNMDMFPCLDRLDWTTTEGDYQLSRRGSEDSAADHCTVTGDVGSCHT